MKSVKHTRPNCTKQKFNFYVFLLTVVDPTNPDLIFRYDYIYPIESTYGFNFKKGL